MELTTLIEALQREVEKRSAVDHAAEELAHALGVPMTPGDYATQAIEHSFRQPLASRLRSVEHGAE